MCCIAVICCKYHRNCCRVIASGQLVQICQLGNPVMLPMSRSETLIPLLYSHLTTRLVTLNGKIGNQKVM